ncbi:MAG: hypothetical protein JW751_01355 [Polyangiaceae bacterium]|nr:hypothetical protein [Polyangiaceae bacterium]
MPHYLFAFEGLGEELPSPPIAAHRALRCAGILLTRAGWEAIPIEVRQAIAIAGAEESVDTQHVRRLVDAAPMTEVKMLPAHEDPDPESPPSQLSSALGPRRPPSREFWQSLRALDRYVMVRLAPNARLFHRLLDELAQRPSGETFRRTAGWTGAVAHAEVQLTTEIFGRLRSPDHSVAFHAARTAGLRAARLADEILELSMQEPVGPVELAATERRTAGGINVVWQGHASTTAGRFSRGASLLATTSAAIALYDFVVDWVEPGAVTIQNARIVEEPWLAETHDGAPLA